MLEFNNVSATYGSLTALKDITLNISNGERVGIFGHNGAGKTTLLRCAVGAHDELNGTVTYNGEEIAPGTVHMTVRKGLGFVPQGHNVFPNLSVRQNLHIAGLLFDQEFINHVYELFPVLSERANQRAGLMSGGEQQMLALGMALMTQPKVLLLDEPSTGLAPVIVRNLMARLLEVSQSLKTALVMVEQNVPATLKIVDRAIIVKSGGIVFDGAATELQEHEEMWEWF